VKSILVPINKEGEDLDMKDSRGSAAGVDVGDEGRDGIIDSAALSASLG